MCIIHIYLLPIHKFIVYCKRVGTTSEIRRKYHILARINHIGGNVVNAATSVIAKQTESSQYREQLKLIGLLNIEPGQAQTT